MPELRQALSKPESNEAKKRIEGLLEQGETLSGEDLRTLRCVEMLERLGTEEARQLLKRLADGAPGAFTTTQAAEALQRLK